VRKKTKAAERKKICYRSAKARRRQRRQFNTSVPAELAKLGQLIMLEDDVYFDLRYG
jgi:hypothetical protein